MYTVFNNAIQSWWTVLFVCACIYSVLLRFPFGCRRRSLVAILVAQSGNSATAQSPSSSSSSSSSAAAKWCSSSRQHRATIHRRNFFVGMEGWAHPQTFRSAEQWRQYRSNGKTVPNKGGSRVWPVGCLDRAVLGLGHAGLFTASDKCWPVTDISDWMWWWTDT